MIYRKVATELVCRKTVKSIPGSNPGATPKEEMV